MEFPEGSSGVGADDSKNYIKLKDKEWIKGVFRGQPITIRKHWIDKKPYPCAGSSNGCQYCDGDKARWSFRLNLVIKEGENYVAKIFEQGWTVYGQLKELNAEYPLETTVVKISRSGSGINDTSYSILPVKDAALTPELAAQIAKVPLIDLVPKPEAAPPMGNVKFPESTIREEDVPF